MADKKTLILKKMDKMIQDAKITLARLEEENTADNQFDYVNSPLLAEWSSRLAETVRKINKIVYQEN